MATQPQHETGTPGVRMLSLGTLILAIAMGIASVAFAPPDSGANIGIGLAFFAALLAGAAYLTGKHSRGLLPLLSLLPALALLVMLGIGILEELGWI